MELSLIFPTLIFLAFFFIVSESHPVFLQEIFFEIQESGQYGDENITQDTTEWAEENGHGENNDTDGESSEKSENPFLACCPELTDLIVIKPEEEDYYYCQSTETLLERSLNCSSIQSFVNDEDIWFEPRYGEIQVGLSYWLTPAWLKLENNQYCIGNSTPTKGSSPKETLLFCDLHGYNKYIVHRTLYSVLYLVSCAFFFAIVLIHVLIYPDLNTHASAQLSFFCALFLFYLVEGIRMAQRLDGAHLTPSFGCFVHAVISQYMFMTLNTTSAVLGLDLLISFRTMDARRYKVKDQRLLLKYILMGWLPTLIFVSLSLVIHDFTSVDAEKERRGYFEYAHYRCSSPVWYFGFYVQIGLYALNVGIFTLASLLIYRHKRRKITGLSRRSNATYSKLVQIYVKLSAILGMNWLTVALDSFIAASNPMALVWVILRSVNLIMGILYFFVFGLTAMNVHLLKKRYSFFRKILCCSDPTNGQRKSSSVTYSA